LALSPGIARRRFGRAIPAFVFYCKKMIARHKQNQAGISPQRRMMGFFSIVFTNTDN
jgi:hypothetical protein